MKLLLLILSLTTLYSCARPINESLVTGRPGRGMKMTERERYRGMKYSTWKYGHYTQELPTVNYYKIVSHK